MSEGNKMENKYVKYMFTVLFKIIAYDVNTSRIIDQVHNQNVDQIT